MNAAVLGSVVRTNVGTILTTYVVVFAVFAVGAWRLIARGKRLSRDVPADDRPWT